MLTLALLLRNRLELYLAANTVFTQVYTRCEETNLFGVTISEIQTDHVVFVGAGSGAAGTYIIRTNDIVGLEI